MNLNAPRTTLVASLLLAGLCGLGGACEGSDQDNEATGNATGGPQELDCTPNQGDGRTACSNETCTAGEYCENDFVCSAGCESTLNCGAGEFCDMRMPITDGFGATIGICRSASDPVCSGASTNASEPDPDPDPESETADPSSSGDVPESCPDVEDNYRIELDGSSPSECEVFITDGDMCSVAQSGCELTWGCGAHLSAVLTPGPIDDNGIYEVSGTQMGVDYECTFDFTAQFPARFTFSCSAGQAGQAIVCSGTGR